MTLQLDLKSASTNIHTNIDSNSKFSLRQEMEPGNHADPNNKVLNSKLTIQSTPPHLHMRGGGLSLKGADRKNYSKHKEHEVKQENVILPIFYLR